MPCGCSSSCGCVVQGDGATTSVIQIGNTFIVSSNGVLVNDTDSINLTTVGDTLSADLILDGVTAPANALVVTAGQGAYVPRGANLGVTDTTSVDHTIASGVLSSTVVISPTVGNQLQQLGDGLYVQQGAGGVSALSVSDTASINLTYAADNISADLRLDSAASPANALVVTGVGATQGAYVPKGANVTVTDTTSINLTATNGDITAAVIPNTSAGLENQAGGVSIKLQGDPASAAATCDNRLRFVTGTGDLTILPDGATISSITAGAAVSLAGTAGNASTNSKTINLTNNEACPVIVRINATGVIISPSSGATVNRVFGQQMRLEVSAVGGGAANISGSGLHGVFDSDYNSTVNAAIAQRWYGHMETWLTMPASSTATIISYCHCLETQVGWTTTTGAGASYQATNIQLSVWGSRSGSWSVGVS